MFGQCEEMVYIHIALIFFVYGARTFMLNTI